MRTLHVIRNHIYFLSAVSQRSIYSLGKVIDRLHNDYERLKYDNRDIAEMTSKPIYLHLNTNGGCLASGWIGATMIKNSPIDINTVIEGNCCSSGTIMSVVGKRRYIDENGYMMIHQLSAEIGGTFQLMKDNIDMYKKDMERMVRHYEQYSTMSKSEIQRRLKNDHYLDAVEAIKCGLVDEIYKPSS